MLLPLTNPVWFGDMILGRIGASLEQMTLDIILFMKLLMLIGLNSDREFGNSTLGRRTKQACVMYLGIE